MLSLLKPWRASGMRSGRCWRPSVPSLSVTAGRGSGRPSGAVSQLTMSHRRCAWPPSRRCRATRIRDDRSWPSCMASPPTRLPTRIARPPGTALNRRMSCRSASPRRPVPNRWPSRVKRRPAGLAGAQHPGVVPASARLARPGPRVGRPGDGNGRFGPGVRCGRPHRARRGRARRWPVRGVGGGATARR